MNIVGTVTVRPRLPKAIDRLDDLAFNLWWTWELDAQRLYSTLDLELWDATNHNPVRFLHRVAQARLEHAAADPEYMERYADVFARLDAYMDPEADTWFKREFGESQRRQIAYFSAEFGLHESLPIYSGGLGILSGDHCKSASDLGLPFVGIGFLYPQGYFTQRIDGNGMQQAEYQKVDFSEVPAVPALGPDGNEVLISVNLPGRAVYAKVWKIQVGRIAIYLMDTDVERNAPPDRELSARLYGGDREMRISQEVVLGIGGVRAVRALGFDPSVWHMNEGHSAFLGLERVRELTEGKGLTFDEAIEVVRANSVFTTHTPVPAGNDSFDFALVEKFFWQYWSGLGISRERFMEIARQELPWGPQYSMTVLALHMSDYANGVSRLHGAVSREMWTFLWPGTPAAEVPIGYVTNGVHTKTWLQPELRSLYAEYFPPEWGEEFDRAERWTTDRLPPEALWEAHQMRKAKLIEVVRARLRRQAIRHGEGPATVNAVSEVLDPTALTIGFARRFATYKRATLIFHDEERLLRILNNPDRPVQLVFAGKAHPADDAGKALIQKIFMMSRDPKWRGRIVFVEDYDIHLARHLVSGTDVWLNNPRRPMEASGTSGQKAGVNGVPNFSVLDGWWEEGFDGENGWAIGESRSYKDEATQDEADAISLYTTLEETIIPLYFERTSGVPLGWVEVMKDSIHSNGPRFSMDRQVKDYVRYYYIPAVISGSRNAGDNYSLARELAAWKAAIRPRWSGLRVEGWTEGTASVSVGEPIEVRGRVFLNGLKAEDVMVEAVYSTHINGDGDAILHTQPLAIQSQEGDDVLYAAQIMPSDSGHFEVGVRARPNHAYMVPFETGLLTWGSAAADRPA